MKGARNQSSCTHSIFDNERYVPGLPPVIEQLRQALPSGWRATLLAVDGATSEDVPAQLKKLSGDTTHLIISCGGNDALGESTILRESAHNVGDALSVLHDVCLRFQRTYSAMLQTAMAIGKPLAVCTIYDAIPGLGTAEKAALAGFNDVILRIAFLARLPVIDLRMVCDLASDYSEVSPIEPSAQGGSKIARTIADLVLTHDFTRTRSTIYA